VTGEGRNDQSTAVVELRPILKWPGGKRQVLPAIRPFVPSTYRRYIEPFLGGGAVLFDLSPPRAIVNDVNAELISLYQTIRDFPDELIATLTSFPVTSDFYYELRAWDRDPDVFLRHSDTERAARTVYLNRTVFNGLYRVNRRGQFNGSWGKYVDPRVCDEGLIRRMSDYLSTNQIEFRNGDFSETVAEAGEGDFLYADPPYSPPDNATSAFTRYTPDGFDHQSLVTLKDSLDCATERGAFWLLSNVRSELTLRMFPESRYVIKEIRVSRRINTNASGRGAIPEILVHPRHKVSAISVVQAVSHP
jgi:DNA adenine methylase